MYLSSDGARRIPIISGERKRALSRTAVGTIVALVALGSLAVVLQPKAQELESTGSHNMHLQKNVNPKHSYENCRASLRARGKHVQANMISDFSSLKLVFPMSDHVPVHVTDSNGYSAVYDLAKQNRVDSRLVDLATGRSAHKIIQIDPEWRAMSFLYSDNSMVVVDTDSCSISAVFMSHNGAMHPRVAQKYPSLGVAPAECCENECTAGRKAMCRKGVQFCFAAFLKNSALLGCTNEGAQTTFGQCNTDSCAACDCPSGPSGCTSVPSWTCSVSSASCSLQSNIASTTTSIASGLQIASTSLNLAASVFTGFGLSTGSSLFGVVSKILGTYSSDPGYDQLVNNIAAEMTRLANCAVHISDDTTMKGYVETISSNLDPSNAKCCSATARIDSYWNPNEGWCHLLLSHVKVVNDRNEAEALVYASALLPTLAVGMEECALNFVLHIADKQTAGQDTSAVEKKFNEQLQEALVEINNALEFLGRYWRKRTICFNSQDGVDTHLDALKESTFDLVYNLVEAHHGECSILAYSEPGGNDISSSIVSGVAECQSKCVANSACLFYAYRKSDKNCWLKHSATTWSANGDGNTMGGGCHAKPHRVCYRYEGYEAGSFNMAGRGGLHAADVRMCEAMCLGYDGCSTYNFRSDLQKCWLKTSNAEKNIATSPTGYDTVGVCRPLKDAGECVSLRNADTPSYNIKSISVSNLQECKSACISHSSCKFYTYDASQSGCWLKTDSTGFRYKSDVVSGACFKSNKKSCDRWNGWNVIAAEISGRTDMDATEVLACELLCMQQDSCEWYSYDEDAKSCTLNGAGAGAFETASTSWAGRCP